MERLGLFYVRFMDDVLVLAPSRWKLRRAVRAVNEILQTLRREKHPDKTFIGRIEKGFDFLGYHFGPNKPSLPSSTRHLGFMSKSGEETDIPPHLRAMSGGGWVG